MNFQAATVAVTVVKVLIVEDEPVLAEFLETCIGDMGLGVVGPVATCADALALLDHEAPSIALLDTQLVGETSEAVVNECRLRNVAVIVSTGMLEAPEFCDGLPVLNKPYSEEALRDALRGAL